MCIRACYQQQWLGYQSAALKREAERVESQQVMGLMLAHKDAEIAALKAELEAVKKDAELYRWLHDNVGIDKDGWQWGVYKVKWAKNGNPTEVLHTLSDSSDLEDVIKNGVCALCGGSGFIYSALDQGHYGQATPCRCQDAAMQSGTSESTQSEA